MIVRVDYNWFQDSDGERAGEDYSIYEVGKNNVVKITEHWLLPRFHYCAITFKDGHQERVMNINRVVTDGNGF